MSLQQDKVLAPCAVLLIRATSCRPTHFQASFVVALGCVHHSETCLTATPTCDCLLRSITVYAQAGSGRCCCTFDSSSSACALELLCSPPVKRAADAGEAERRRLHDRVSKIGGIMSYLRASVAIMTAANKRSLSGWGSGGRRELHAVRLL